MKAHEGGNSKLRDEGLIPSVGIESVDCYSSFRASIRIEGTQLSVGFSIDYHALAGTENLLGDNGLWQVAYPPPIYPLIIFTRIHDIKFLCLTSVTSLSYKRLYSTSK